MSAGGTVAEKHRLFCYQALMHRWNHVHCCIKLIIMSFVPKQHPTKLASSSISAIGCNDIYQRKNDTSDTALSSQFVLYPLCRPISQFTTPGGGTFSGSRRLVVPVSTIVLSMLKRTQASGRRRPPTVRFVMIVSKNQGRKMSAERSRPASSSVRVGPDVRGGGEGGGGQVVTLSS